MSASSASWVFLASTVLSVSAASVPKLTGTYSSLQMGTEDLHGVEISIVIGGKGYFAIVQCAEGVPGIPQVVPAQIAGLSLQFTLENSATGCPASAFQGTVSANGLTGAFEGTTWPGFMRRRKGYWQ